MTAVLALILAALAVIGATVVLTVTLNIIEQAHVRGMARLARARQEGRL